MMLYNMTRQKGLQFVLRLNKYWLLSLQEKFTNQVFVQIHKSISIYIYIYIKKLKRIIYCCYASIEPHQFHVIIFFLFNFPIIVFNIYFFNIYIFQLFYLPYLFISPLFSTLISFFLFSFIFLYFCLFLFTPSTINLSLSFPFYA